MAAGHAPRNSVRRRRFRAVTVLAALLAALVLLEVGLRVVHGVRGTYDVTEDALRARRDSPWIASDDPELVYVHRPGKRAEGERKIESHGILRPTEVALAKPGGSLRVAVLGDSVGASLYLAHEERFTTLLERRLAAETGRPVEVLNFCVNGYDTVQEARLLETAVTRFAPDLVLLVYCLNDPAESVVPLGWFRDPEPPVSHALDFLWSGLRGASGRPLAPGEGPRGRAADLWARMYDPAGPGWAATTRGLDRIAAWGRTNDTPVLVAVTPLLLDGDPRGGVTSAYRRAVLDELAARDLTAVDLQDELLRRPLSAVRADEDDIYHLSAEGHAIVADVLAPRVRDRLLRAR